MKLTRKSDILLNVCLPLTIGLLIYCSEKIVIVPALIRNYLPDGLWAYAFLSCNLLIWHRSVNLFWVFLVFLVAFSFEVLQYLHIIPGTGDIKDVFTYFLAFAIALLLNTPFKNKIFQHPQTILV
jgi:hypothetical protein